MNKIALCLLINIFFIVDSKSQSVEGHGDPHAYEQAVGIRGGFGGGITYKKQLGNESNYGELVLNYFDRILALRGLYERTQPLKADGLRWYYGGGPALGLGSQFNVGISGIIGIEFTFFEIPLNASLDYAPTFLLFRSDEEGNIFDPQVGALSLRYILR